MGEASETQLIHQGDDPLYVLAPSIDGEDDLLIPISDIDEKYAGKLQLQEVLMSSALSMKAYNETHATESELVIQSRRNTPQGEVVIQTEADRIGTISTGFVHDPDDRKGKRVVGAPEPSPPAAGQSSRSKEAYCGICMESKDPLEFFGMKLCPHEFCKSCVSQYVAAKVEENVTLIGCPDPGCGVGSLEPEMCRSILAQGVFDRWGSALCEATIESRFYCPYRDCSALMIDEGGDCGGEAVIRESECPHCFRLFCAQCRVPWHGEMGCEEFQGIEEGEREREDLMLRKMARSCSWQRCPKCRFYVERIDGCMFMQCRCGYRFCYGCASPMTEHYCSKCKR